MSFLGAVLMILTGLVIMAFGLFLFYAWLPLLYAIVGFDIGALLGKWMTGEVGVLAITFGIAGAVVLGLASYYLEPFRRILLGVSAGVLIGLALANFLGMDGRTGAVLGGILAIVLGLIGGSVVPRYFDIFIIFATALSGASMVMSGAHLIMPNIALFDVVSGGWLPHLLTIVLAAIGVGWQFNNIEKWLRASGVMVIER